jgi:uncharacterized protein YegL
LVLDCSESMAGPAIEEVSRGVDALVSALLADPLAVETAYVSVITFSRSAKQVVPLTEILQFQAPKLTVRTGTAYGAVLRLLLMCLQREVIKTTPTTKGDYKPLVFLMTDGQPTDDWEAAADALRAANDPKIANIHAIGCGPDVDADALRRITNIVLRMSDTSVETFRKTFVWLSASIQAGVRSVEGTAASDDALSLPEGILEYASGPSKVREDEMPRQVFLHARCRRTKKPYLMRFVRLEHANGYTATASHPLDELEEGDADLLAPINSPLLDGCPSCPYCENPVASPCPCGAIFCDERGSVGPVTCPACGRELFSAPGGGGDGFDLPRALG